MSRDASTTTTTRASGRSLSSLRRTASVAPPNTSTFSNARFTSFSRSSVRLVISSRKGSARSPDGSRRRRYAARSRCAAFTARSNTCIAPDSAALCAASAAAFSRARSWAFSTSTNDDASLASRAAPEQDRARADGDVTRPRSAVAPRRRASRVAAARAAKPDMPTLPAPRRGPSLERAPVHRDANARRRAFVVVMGASSGAFRLRKTKACHDVSTTRLRVAATLRAPCHVRHAIISNRLAPRFPNAAAAAAPLPLLLGSISSL